MSSSSVKNSLDDSKEISKKVTVTVKEAKKTVIKEAKISDSYTQTYISFNDFIIDREIRYKNNQNFVDEFYRVKCKVPCPSLKVTVKAIKNVK